jgi:hypothetical protein
LYSPRSFAIRAIASLTGTDWSLAGSKKYTTSRLPIRVEMSSR